MRRKEKRTVRDDRRDVVPDCIINERTSIIFSYRINTGDKEIFRAITTT